MTDSELDHPRVSALRPHSVRTGGLVVQSAGMIAPAAGLVAANVFIAALAGKASTDVQIIGTLVALCFAVAIGGYAKKLPSAGSFYTYLTKTFGLKTGFVTGVTLFLAYLLVLPFQVAFLGEYVHNIVASAWNINIPWQLVSVALILLSTGLAVAGIQPALRVALILLAVEIATFTLLSLLIIGRGGATGNSVAPFNPANSLTGSSGLFLGVVFSIFLFSGFESATSLAEEAHEPRRTIPRALIFTVLFVGLFFILVTYAETIGFGLSANGVHQFTTNQIPFNDLANRYGDGALSTLINLATISSFITLNIVTLNVVSRVLFGMSRDRLLPKIMSHVNSRQVPYFSSLIVGAWGLLSALILGTIYGPNNAASYVAFIGTLFFIAAYILVMIGVPRFYYRDYRSEFNWWTSLLVPVIGLAGVLVVLYGTVHPLPPAPLRYFIFVAIAAIVASALIALVLERRNPYLMREAGRLFAQADTPPDDMIPATQSEP